MKKKYLVIVIAAFFVFLIIAKDQIIKRVVVSAAKKVLGVEVRIGGLSLGVFRQRVIIKNLKVYNPPDFPKERLLSVPKIRVDYDLGALLKKKIHLTRLEVDLKEMLLVKNKQGKLNVDALKVAQKEEGPAEPQQAMPFKIDYLVLSIGQVVYKDFSTQDKPVVEAFDVNIKDKVYKNITDARQLAALVITEAMRQTTIKSAGIYAASSLAGVAILPFAAAVMFTSSDSVNADFNKGWDEVFTACSEALRQAGRLTSEDKAKGLLNGESTGSSITVKLEKAGSKIKVTVSARKYLFPKKEIAAGLLFQISEKLKR